MPALCMTLRHLFCRVKLSSSPLQWSPACQAELAHVASVSWGRRIVRGSIQAYVKYHFHDVTCGKGVASIVTQNH